MVGEVLRSLENQVASVCMGAPSRIVRLRSGVVEKLEATVGRRAIVVHVPGETLPALILELGRRVDGRPRSAVLVDPLVRELAGEALGEEHAALAEFLTAEALDEVPALAGRVLLARVAPVIAKEAGVAPAVVTALIAARTGLGAFEAPGVDVLRELGRLAARAHVAIVVVGGDATLLEGAPGFVLVDEFQTTRSGRVRALDETPRLELPGLPAPVIAPVTVTAPAPVEVKAAEPVAEPIVPAPSPPKAPVVPVEVRPPRAERSTLRKCVVAGLPFVFIASASVFALVEGEAWWHRAPSEVTSAPELGSPVKPVLNPVALTASATPTTPVVSWPDHSTRRSAPGSGRGREPQPPPPPPPRTAASMSPPPSETMVANYVRAVDMARTPADMLFALDHPSWGKPDPALALAQVERLLDRPPGGPLDDARQLRVALIGHLSEFTDRPEVVDRVLKIATNPSAPQQERLTAITVLRAGEGGLAPNAREVLLRIAQVDADPAVRQAASAVEAISR